MAGSRDAWVATAFATDLGWMVTLGRGAKLRQLSIGHASPAQALAALDHEQIAAERSLLRVGRWNPQLVARLKAFAGGNADDFLDVEIEPLDRSAFTLRVIEFCRRISYGQTLSYGKLAELADAPRAARAVGTVMASNRVALIIPCHRVVRADGGIGGYTSPAGIELKKRLLTMEAKMGGAKQRSSRRRLQVAGVGNQN